MAAILRKLIDVIGLSAVLLILIATAARLGVVRLLPLEAQVALVLALIVLLITAFTGVLATVGMAAAVAVVQFGNEAEDAGDSIRGYAGDFAWAELRTAMYNSVLAQIVRFVTSFLK